MNWAHLTTADDSVSASLLGVGGSMWILLAVIVASAVADWLKKRASATGADKLPGKPPAGRDSTAPSRPASATVPQTPNWEEELRRLLGVEPPPEKPPVVTPPPVPQVRTPPTPVRRPASAAPTREPAPLANIEPQFTEAQRVTAVHLPELRQSSLVYQQASQLQEQVAGQLKRAEEQTERHLVRVSPTRSDSFSREAAAVVSLLREPRTARQAIIASLILSSPKGLPSE